MIVEGHTYKAHTFIRPRIIRDGTDVLYEMPMQDFLAKILFYGSGLSWMILGIIEFRKRKNAY